ncbi:Signal transduction histidine kinase [Parasphingorhabdus marina DSM 22363]|uniref:histidine kinase n=1 Tax=Parasphingorhabdus marina DSM 22363 TaxID=1123272 RepID=A0A1N6D0E5_9SPHN|nr:Signal transduction histidine kinase [Parasphingorhabdus marina DSM 22363]
MIELRQDDPSRNISQNISYLLDPQQQLTLSQLQQDPEAFDFRKVTKSEPNFGFQKGAIWLRLKLHNPGNEELSRIFAIETNFVSEIEVFQEIGGSTRSLMKQNTEMPFRTRPVDYHQLAVPFSIEAGQQTVLWVRYRTSGLTALPMSIETLNSFNSRSNREMALNFAFYGIIGMFLIASIAAAIFAPARIFIYYFFYAAAVLIYIFHRDGYAFQFLWPDWPRWNAYASLPLAAALTAFASQFTRSYLNTRDDYPVYDRILLGIILLQVLMVLATVVVDSELIKQLMTISITLCAMLFLTAGLSALRTKGRRVLFFVIGWSGIVVASLTTFTAHWLDIEVTRSATLDTMRTSMIFDAFMMGVACVSVVSELRKEREQLMAQRAASAERNFELAGRLAGLEQKYELAQAMVENSNRMVANTTHDLRQPLHSLRSVIHNLSDRTKTDKSEIDHIEQSLQYMESLVEENLNQASEDRRQIPETPDRQMSASHILQAIATIFAQEAEAAGIRLKVVPSSAQMTANSVAVLRILSNLVANAIAYAPGARILVGIRRRNRHLVFEVHDTGPGMTAEQLKAAKQRSQRGNQMADGNPDGKGLGLSIVDDLTEQIGSVWKLSSVPGKGTVAQLFLDPW